MIKLPHSELCLIVSQSADGMVGIVNAKFQIVVMIVCHPVTSPDMRPFQWVLFL